MPSLGWQELVILFILYGVPAAALILVLVSKNRNRKPYARSEYTSLSENEVIQSALKTYVANGYQVVSQSGQSVTFTGKPGVNVGILLLTLMAGIIAGIAYWFLARREIVVTIDATSRADGTHVNLVSTAQGHGARELADHFLATLPSVDGFESGEIPNV